MKSAIVRGFEHRETGLMRPNRTSKLKDGISDAEIYRAALIRMARSVNTKGGNLLKEIPPLLL